MFRVAGWFCSKPRCPVPRSSGSVLPTHPDVKPRARVEEARGEGGLWGEARDLGSGTLPPPEVGLGTGLKQGPSFCEEDRHGTGNGRGGPAPHWRRGGGVSPSGARENSGQLCRVHVSSNVRDRFSPRHVWKGGRCGRSVSGCAQPHNHYACALRTPVPPTQATSVPNRTEGLAASHPPPRATGLRKKLHRAVMAHLWLPTGGPLQNSGQLS